MVAVSTWIIAVVVLVIVIFIALGIGWYIRNHAVPPAVNNPAFLPISTWSSPPGIGPNPAKNVCETYTFPTAIVSIGGIPTIIPGTPTLETTTLDNINGNNTLPLCIDSDQIVARQVRHVCQHPPGVTTATGPNLCKLITGGTVDIGTVEVFYTDNGCFNIGHCPGQLSLVSINYQAPISPPNCIQETVPPTNSATMAVCNPSVPQQLFRITRVDPGQNPATLNTNSAQNGLIAQILDRNNGLCMTKGAGTSTTIFDPSYGGSGCTQPPISISGPNVIFDTCVVPPGPATVAFAGYVWALLPALTYCPNVGGCSPSQFLTTPPQIIYVGNIDLSTFPTNGNFGGFTGSAAIIAWLRANNALALYSGGGTNTGLILTPFGTDITDCRSRGYVAQYLNLTLFNTLSVEAACQGTNPAPGCVPL